jgi:hypothetical protein
MEFVFVIKDGMVTIAVLKIVKITAMEMEYVSMGLNVNAMKKTVKKYIYFPKYFI